VLQTADKTNEAIALAAAEVKATREMIPSVLTLTEKIAANLQKAGKEASEGAATGILY